MGHRPRPFWKQFYTTREPGQTPMALIDPGARFFTMGSCFANELRAELMSRGITVLPAVDPGLHPLFDERAKEVSSWGAWDERVQLQFYNTFSIRQEFEKAFGLWEQAPNDYWEVRPLKQTPFWQDPYRRRVFAPSLDAVRHITKSLDEKLRQAIQTADVFVFTLGLTEVWKKKDNLLVACAEPGYCGGGGQQECWFHPSTYEENLANMRTVLKLLAAHRPNAQVYITVSPVSLGRTFQPDLDVAVANMASKSILRAVVASLVTEYPHLRYFPSYEMCIYDWEHAFCQDGRHVQRSKVQEIMNQFCSTWMKESVSDSRLLALLQREEDVADWMDTNISFGNPQADAVLQTWISGYREVISGRPCPEDAYLAMRQLHIATEGQIDPVIQELIGILFPCEPVTSLDSPLLGEWNVERQLEILDQLRENGLAILPCRLDSAWVDQLREHIDAQPMTANGYGPKLRLGQQGVECARLIVEEDALLRLEQVQQLLNDPVVVALAGQYLGCQPIFDFAASFRSFPIEATHDDRSRSAQQYHFDKDRISFIKLFCYLTDVDEEAGPHVFVAGSKQNRPKILWRDGRLSDDEVERAYSKEAILRICGPRGTLFLADTASLHKGLPPQTRSRAVLQIEYASSLFGHHYPTQVRRADFGAWAEDAPPRLLVRFS